MVPTHLIGEWRNIVHPIDDGHVLIEVEVFAEFLEPGMEISNIGNRFDNGFAVECEDQSECCMRGGVLRAEVEGVEKLLVRASHVVRYQLLRRHVGQLSDRVIVWKLCRSPWPRSG